MAALLDLEIDFDSKVIGRQRMIFDWTPRKYIDDVSRARTFGFVRDAKILRQAGYALGSSLDNSITVHEDRILNPGGLRYEDEFVRHKLLDAIGDLALCGLPIYGRFRSYKGGHALNALVLQGLFASEANYEIVYCRGLAAGVRRARRHARRAGGPALPALCRLTERTVLMDLVFRPHRRCYDAAANRDGAFRDDLGICGPRPADRAASQRLWRSPRCSRPARMFGPTKIKDEEIIPRRNAVPGRRCHNMDKQHYNTAIDDAQKA